MGNREQLSSEELTRRAEEEAQRRRQKRWQGFQKQRGNDRASKTVVRTNGRHGHA